MTPLVKHSGQVFTPDYLVNLILDEAEYRGTTILSKHCIDNSCGDGAFLCEIVSRYIIAYKDVYGSLSGVEKDLSKYIHGIEIDPVAFNNCLDNLESVCNTFGIYNVRFDIYNEDTLKSTRYDGMMDFVIGNPPYVRVHNLENFYDTVKSFSFANGGMTDLFLVFFEKGFRMLREYGKLCYITPSSWLNSVAGGVMRDYIRRKHNLISLIDLGHFQAFKATTYTLISLFEKGVRRDSFSYNVFDENIRGKSFITDLSFAEVDINGTFYLSTHNTLANLKRILTTSTPKYVSVKNGFATLADKVFINTDFPFSKYVIPTIKASTGKWYSAFFPYNSYGKPFTKDELFADREIASYMDFHKNELLKGAKESDNPYWFLYGRSQALKDVAHDKIAINTTIRDLKSLKINFVPNGSGIYSGLYILSNFNFDVISNILNSVNFIDYIASLKKYKSGGYYTFNSKDLEAYLNFSINSLIEHGTLQLPPVKQSGLFASIN